MERLPNTKINMEPQRALNGENNFEKEEQRWNFLTLPDFQKYYKSTAIKTVWHQHRSRHRPVEQNRKPTNKPTLKCQMIVNKYVKCAR